tara:strand:+ start:2081 stop:2317 length:237 start_codon:yes stop_codon:yes gene_type:complete
MTKARLLFIFEADDLARRAAVKPSCADQRSSKIKVSRSEMLAAGSTRAALLAPGSGFPLNAWQKNHAGITNPSLTIRL